MQLSVATGSVLGSTQFLNIYTFYVLQGIVGKKLWSTGLQLRVMWVWSVSLCSFYSIHMWFLSGEIKPKVVSPLVKFVYCRFSVQSVTVAENVFNLHSVLHSVPIFHIYMVLLGRLRCCFQTCAIYFVLWVSTVSLSFFHGHKPF